MNVPRVYAEWCALFDEITVNAADESYIALIGGSSVDWSDGVAQRFMRAFIRMASSRVKRAHDRYRAAMREGLTGSELAVLLDSLGAEYRYLMRLVDVLPIPGENAATLRDHVLAQAEQTYAGLRRAAEGTSLAPIIAASMIARIVNK